MTDNELALALVDANILRLSAEYSAWDRYRLVDADGAVLGGSYNVVRDWRVAGTCLEQWPTTINTEHLQLSLDEMLRRPVAIIEAFVNAIAPDEKGQGHG